MTPTTEIGIIVAIVLNITLQIAQMFFDFQSKSQDSKIATLQEDLARALKKIDVQEQKITALQAEVFEIKKSESYYKGRLEALEPLVQQQSEKLDATRKYIKEHTK